MTGQPLGFHVTSDSGGFIRVSVPCDRSFQWMLAAVDRLKDVLDRGVRLRVLLDLSCVQPPGLVEQAILGEHLARKLSHCDKVASLVSQGTRTGTSEQVAQRLNLALRVFTVEADAIAWLTN